MTIIPMQSEELNEISAALSKAQKSFGIAFKDKDNPFTKSKYASYESMRRVCQEALSDNGLSICHQLTVVDGKRAMLTILLHTSGQWLKSYLLLSAKDEAPQSIGSAITYAMRYSLAAMLAIPSGDKEDDDGEGAQQAYRNQIEVTADEFLQEEQVKKIEEMVGADHDLADKILAGYAKKYGDSVDTFYDIKAKDFGSALHRIQLIKNPRPVARAK